MNGYSYRERYRELYMYTFITYVSILIIGIAIIRVYFLEVIMFNICALGFEFIVLYGLIKKFGNSNVANILKGESRL